MSKVKKMSFSEKSRKKTFADQNRGVRWVLKEKNTKKKHKKRQNVFFCEVEKKKDKKRQKRPFISHCHKVGLFRVFQDKIHLGA